MKFRLCLLAGIALSIAAAGAASAASQLTQVAQFDHQVTGVTVAKDGRRFVNFPRWTDDAPVSVAEVLPGGRLRPYPDAEWNSWFRMSGRGFKPVSKPLQAVTARRMAREAPRLKRFRNIPADPGRTRRSLPRDPSHHRQPGTRAGLERARQLGAKSWARNR